MTVKRIIVLALVGIFTLSAFTLPNTGGGGGAADQTRMISVTGTGKVYITPDIATINIGVHTEEADVAAALASNTSKLQAVNDTLKGFGIDPVDIQTTNFSVYPSQQYSPTGETLDTKYAVDNTLLITVRDLSKFGDVLSSVVTNGANNVYGITFDVADRSQAIAEARKSALENAQKQAQELAAAAGVTLGQVMSLGTNTSEPTPIYADYYGRGGAMMDSAAAVPVSSGQLVISVDVYISYEMK